MGENPEGSPENTTEPCFDNTTEPMVPGEEDDSWMTCNITAHTCEAEDECCTEESFVLNGIKVAKYSCMKVGDQEISK